MFSIPSFRLAPLALALSVAIAAPALADHPDPAQMEQVARVAHELERDSSRVHRLAEASVHHPGWGQERALSDLHRLEEAAEHFHRQVERFRNDPAHTESDYLSLEKAFQDAEQSFRMLHATWDTRIAFSEVRSSMKTLRQFYSAGPRTEDAQRLAHQLEEQARHARQAAERERHHGDAMEWYAIESLRRLERRAGHFHQQIEGGTDPFHLSRDLYELENSLRFARWYAGQAHMNDHVLGDLAEAAETLEQLRRIVR